MNKQQAQQIMKEMEERGINDVQLFHYGPGDYSVAGQCPIDGGRFTVHTFENWEGRKFDADIDWTWRDS